MKHGVLTFDSVASEWRVWIGMNYFRFSEAAYFQILIDQRYFNTLLKYDDDWYITLIGELPLILHRKHHYNIRVSLTDLIPAPF